jgi:hypothetical protein
VVTPVSLVRDLESLTHNFHIGQPLTGDTTVGSLRCILMVNFVVVGCCVHGGASLRSTKGIGFVHELCDD